jgi:putative transposase
VAQRYHRAPTGEGKLYPCAVKDCYSNKIVGYSIASHMRASLAVSALRNAIALRDPRSVVVHSDRGAQFRSAAYRRLLRAHRLTGSMGRVGACGDNAAMESFFSLLQKNVLDTHRWNTRSHPFTWTKTADQILPHTIRQRTSDARH